LMRIFQYQIQNCGIARAHRKSSNWQTHHTRPPVMGTA
jgi:hypothetical protein